MAAGIEPAKERLTAARPYQHGDTTRVGAAGFEPASSCSQSTWTSRFSHTPICQHTECAGYEERPAGVEPALPPWQGSRLPLHHGRSSFHNQIVNEQVGPEGLEPSPSRVRTGHAAANTLIPRFWDGTGVPSYASPVVALRIELSAPRLSAEVGQPALDYRRSREGVGSLWRRRHSIQLIVCRQRLPTPSHIK